MDNSSTAQHLAALHRPTQGPARRMLSSLQSPSGNARWGAAPQPEGRTEVSTNPPPTLPNGGICITGSTSASLHQILPWLYYHKVIGVSHFILFVEGEAAKPAVTSVLESIRGVKIIYRTKELKEQQDRSRIWNETWLSGFFYKPCNYELFVKQSLNMEMAIVMAREAGMDWIIHLDTDELIHPAGAREYSLRRLLLDVPDNVDMVIFPNYESSVERDDIKDPFTEVSMFKKNYDHLPKDTYFGLYKEATRGNPNYFLTYGNGKSAARVQEHMRPNGAHRWHNYMKSPNEIKLEEAAILHYTYTKFSDLTSRRDRCGCLHNCINSYRARDEELFFPSYPCPEVGLIFIWILMSRYREHVVWTDKDTNLKLLRKGVLTRIYAPMAIIRGLKESGIFIDAVTSAKAHPKANIGLENNESIHTKVTASQTTTLKEGGNDNSQATARKILEMIDVQEEAMPPMSPPGFLELMESALS
ncbi:hypothetical protein TRIUR3_27967 [Triticum urartu]|uniref:Glycosyltransferase family 92 protein n=1 Tax=Triticum urartu TaxID=4572 RepID=M7ZAE0_TRIUA|nr:hypothetical protein TRIUR3_27967 [Triticum urartu]